LGPKHVAEKLAILLLITIKNTRIIFNDIVSATQLNVGNYEIIENFRSDTRNFKLLRDDRGTAVAQWLRYCATVGDRGSTVVKELRYSGGQR
jgi:hypothetical protein